MENDKTPFEIIIKKDGEIKYMAKSDCILAVVNNGDARAKQILLSECNGFALASTIIGAQRLIDKQCEQYPELRILIAIDQNKLLGEDQE